MLFAVHLSRGGFEPRRAALSQRREIFVDTGRRLEEEVHDRWRSFVHLRRHVNSDGYRPERAEVESSDVRERWVDELVVLGDIGRTRRSLLPLVGEEEDVLGSFGASKLGQIGPSAIEGCPDIGEGPVGDDSVETPYGFGLVRLGSQGPGEKPFHLAVEDLDDETVARHEQGSDDVSCGKAFDFGQRINHGKGFVD